MNKEEELRLMGCEVITTEETGLKIVVRESEIVLLHLTFTGDAFGSAHLDPANTRRLIHELEDALRKIEPPHAASS